MIDVRILRDNPDLVRASQAARGEDASLVDQWLAADRLWREATARYDGLRADQRNLGKQIGPLQGALKKAEPSQIADLQGQLDKLLTQASALADALTITEAQRDAAGATANETLGAMSNVVSANAPRGGEDDFVVLRQVGIPRNFASEGFEPRDHVDLGRMLGAIDVERGAKVSGSRFYYLTGDGALLELALVNLAMQFAQQNGFTPVIPPALVRPPAMEGTGFLGQAAENVYSLPADDMYLVGTAEVPLAAYHMDEILDASKLPLRYAGYSPCFRREAGSHGRDTRGIFRVHWFDKVEMFSYADPADAEAEHLRLLSYEEEFLQALELPYRVIDVATGDLGASASRKFDCEAWIPTMGTYRELTSTSNCTEFQSRRLRIRKRVGEEITPLATLNGTLTAITRTIVALLENHQRADGSVYIPVALQPLMGGRTELKPVTA